MAKPLFAPGFTSPNMTTGLDAQIGPDNLSSNTITIKTDDLITYLSDFLSSYNPPPYPPGNATSNWFEGYAQQMLDIVDDKMSKVMNIRVNLGTQMNRLKHTINDLNAEYTNVAKSNSQITDADMAEEVVAMTKNMIKQQSTTVAASQANAQPLITINLLDAVYTGLNPTTAWNSHVGPTPEEGLTL
jgi:flagellin-like hook-associated protein FlgL